MPKKNPAAVALGRKGGKARLTKLSPERRSEIARMGADARNGRTPPKPVRWYGVCWIPVPKDLHGGTKAMAKVLDEAQAKPHVLLDNDGTPFWTQDREKARARVREENTRTDSGGFAELIDVDYDPRRFIVHRKFAPDTEAMKKLLKVDLEGGQK